MRNQMSDRLCEQFAATIGGLEHLVSGRGARFRSPRFSRLTVYHDNIAAGNSAEVAFHPQSLAQATGMTEADIRLEINRLRTSTGNEINFNPQQRWPRVGVSTEDHVVQVIAFVHSLQARATSLRQACSLRAPH